VEELNWMAGTWIGTKDGVHSEEIWTAAKGGMLIGMHRDVMGDRAVGFEFFRIQVHEGAITYLSQPGGRPVTPFTLADMGPMRVVFENPSHDFPQRVLYWQTKPNELRARIEGTVNGKEAAEEWGWIKPSDD
jgi:hypothetical protein